MKGVSAVIAIILILMIVVALAALAYTWFTGIFSQLTATTETAVTTTTTTMAANFLIETAYNDTTNNVWFTIRNTGTATIDLNKLGAYVDDVYYDPTGTTLLEPKEYSSLLRITGVPNPKGKTLKITIEQGLEKTTVIQG